MPLCVSSPRSMASGRSTKMSCNGAVMNGCGGESRPGRLGACHAVGISYSAPGPAAATAA